jgi:aryl-alcohol dehydrogenase-like predicted oxidoreductase
MWPQDPNAGGGSRKNIHDSLNHSLRRLKTDYIDLYWLHAHDAFTPAEETMRALDDIVRAGKVRYIGFSDTPAWYLARAQTMAEFRGWSPVIALQIEYSLLQRTVEGELIPAAMELGMGVTPWSPLASGALSGKYSRTRRDADEGGRQWVANKLDDRAYTILDVLEAVAREHSTTVARVALSWVQSRPGVTSTIIGARTMQQLHDNVGALEVNLTDDQVDRIDEVSKPTLNFPHDFLLRAGSFMQGGATIDGRPSEPWPMAPQNESERW